jgi:hypothetical protein
MKQVTNAGYGVYSVLMAVWKISSGLFFMKDGGLIAQTNL